MNNSILEIRNLSTYFFVDREEGKNYSGNYGGDVFTDSASAGFKIPKNKIPAKAVDDVSFDVYEGEITGLIGESGSGKSVTAYSVLGLIQEPEGKIVSGSVSFKGVNLLELSQEEIRKYRGREISMIFQEPREALNPVMKIKNQLSEVLFVHEKVSESEAEKRIIETMSVAGIDEPERIMKEYPHRLSGGMCQRILIAMALLCNPSLIIADEPTTSLDVTIQAQILNLFKKIMKDKKVDSILLITHNFGIVSDLCSRVVVMYGGSVQEIAEVPEIFCNPKHPYTAALLDSVPALEKKQTENLITIPGVVPGLLDMPEGCKFCTRCSRVMDICKEIRPDLKQLSGNHFVRCHLYQ
jgi:oligopeptide/dipeptide ABC transporter ATP-binding protein